MGRQTYVHLCYKSLIASVQENVILGPNAEKIRSNVLQAQRNICVFKSMKTVSSNLTMLSTSLTQSRKFHSILFRASIMVDFSCKKGKVQILHI